MQNSIEHSEVLSTVVYSFFAFILMAAILILFFYYSRKKIMHEQIQKKTLEINYQKELLKSVLETQEAERKRIAQDLHDDISSKLNVVSLNTHLLKSDNLSIDEKNSITNNIIELSSKALENSRSIAHALLPPVLEKFGLIAGIEELVLEFNNSKLISVNFKNFLNKDELKDEKYFHLFRIIQELLNNSIKHGKATVADIILLKEKEKYCFKYSDNGKGFEIENFENKKGLGLKNIESRVNFLDGKLEINSKRNNGIEVLIKFSNG